MTILATRLSGDSIQITMSVNDLDDIRIALLSAEDRLVEDNPALAKRYNEIYWDLLKSYPR